MCEAVFETQISHEVCKPHSSKQSLPSKMEKLLTRLPKLGEEYELDRKVGEGTFSCVYLGRSRLDPKLRVAVKHLIPTCHPARIARELKCMHHLGGRDNIVEVISCYRKHDCVVFVMPYQQHDKFSSYMSDLNVKELQMYLKGLLVALKRVHLHGIIHRDVKPSNFLFHRKTQRFLLVDFGLAQNVEECTKGENGENFSSIKIEPVVPQSSQPEKKRKRDSNDGGVTQIVKRVALQPISNNFSTPYRDSKPSSKYCYSSKIIEENSLKNKSFMMTKSSSVFSKSWYLQSKNKLALESTSVVKKEPFAQAFSNISPSQQKNSFFRIQNSQVKLVGGYFAKPLPVSTSLGSTSLTVQNKLCNCDGHPRVCNKCIIRRARTAPRAGTPGFRPPEVLLKHPNQTTAVDMWAVGVIMLSIMSSTYPFFRSPDDITALAELITIFGSEEMKALAKKFGRNIVCSENRGALDLRKLCQALRRKRSGVENTSGALLKTQCLQCKMLPGVECLCPCTPTVLDFKFPDEAYHLLSRLLDIDPDSRITADEALQHPFFHLNFEK